MAIRQNRVGKYLIDYYPTGRKGRRIVFTLPDRTTKEQALQIEKEIRSKKNKQLITNPSGKIVHLLSSYIDDCRLHQSPETVRDKESHYRIHIIPFFGHMYINELTNTHITLYKKQMQIKTHKGHSLSNQTITKGLNYFSAFLKWAADDLNLYPNQLLNFRKLPYTRPVPIVLSLDECMAFINAAEQPYHALFKILFYLGLRNRAARRLRWEDVDWTKHILKTIEKGNKIKWHPIPDDLLESLRDIYIKSKSTWIFSSPVNFEKPIYNLHRAVKRAKQKAGITKRIYPHLLRHSIATHLVDCDVDIRQIQSFLGHTQISTTEWYAQVSVEKKRQALERAGIKTTKV